MSDIFGVTVVYLSSTVVLAVDPLNHIADGTRDQFHNLPNTLETPDVWVRRTILKHYQKIQLYSTMTRHLLIGKTELEI